MKPMGVMRLGWLLAATAGALVLGILAAFLAPTGGDPSAIGREGAHCHDYPRCAFAAL